MYKTKAKKLFKFNKKQGNQALAQDRTGNENKQINKKTPSGLCENSFFILLNMKPKGYQYESKARNQS